MNKDEFNNTVERLATGRMGLFWDRQRTIRQLIRAIDEHREEWFKEEGYKDIREMLERWMKSEATDPPIH